MNGDPQKGRFLSPSRLAVDEVIVKYKGSLFDIIYPRNKRIRIKIYKLRDETEYTYEFMCAERQCTAQHLTATHEKVSELTEKIQESIFQRTAEISVLVTLSLTD